jgi:putative heme transporter
MGIVKKHSRWIGTVVGLVVVAITFGVVLPRVADYGDVLDVLGRIDPTWGIVLAVVTVVNIVTYAPPWMVALPGLGFRRALAFTQASTAVTFIVPGGGLVGMASSFALLRSWSFPSGDVARAVTLTGIWNQLSNLLLPVVAVALLAAESEADSGLVSVALIGGTIFGVAAVAIGLVLWREDVARAIGDLLARWCNGALGRVRRGPVGWSGDSFARFQAQTAGLLRRRWHLLTLTAIVGNLTVFLVLLVSVRAVGIGSSHLTWIEVFAGWSIARVLGLIPVSPGGVGVVELGVTTALVGFGGANAPVVTAVLLYRFLTIVPTLVIGGATMLVWRRLHPGARGGVSDPAGNRPGNEGSESQG